MTQTQEFKRTKISTVLDKEKQPDGDDPLLLTSVQCSEAFSTPYYMDVMMFAPRTLEIDPQRMINTPATVSVRVEDRSGRRQPGDFNFTYQKRKGVFQSFIRQDRFHRRIGRDFNVYAGRIVPSFLIMDQEVRYRIFEKPDMTFLTILDSCMQSFQGLNMANYAKTDAVKNAADPPPKMEHCVQYGESTYNFLSRLMARFSIWYYFDHDTTGEHEQMILGTGAVGAPQTAGFNACSVFRNFPDPRDLERQGLIEDWQIITGLSRVYTPAPRLTRTSDFNTVISTRPLQSSDADAKVGGNFDIISNHEGSEGHGAPPQTTFVQEQFPDSTIYADKDATGDAKQTMRVAEGQVYTVTAVSKNPSFYAGKFYLYEKGDDNLRSTHHLITRMSFFAYDRDYLFLVSRKDAAGLAALVDDLLVQPGASFVQQFGSSKAPDLATAMSAAGLQEYTQNWVENATATRQAGLGSFFAAGVVGYFTAFLPNITTVLQDLMPIVQIFLKALISVVEGIWDLIMFIPIIIATIAGKNLMTTINRPFEDLKQWIDKFIEHLLKPADIDGFSTSYQAIPLDHTGFTLPFPVARNAQVFGPHLATVIGPNGVEISDGEVWADKIGRVRVRFPWDRMPGAVPLILAGDPLNQPLSNPKNNFTDPSAQLQYLVGEDTAWVRVSDAWAGINFGTQFLPRIGDEVIVSFIDGDPDRPIITGRVYNARNSDSTLPFPNKSDTAQITNMESLRDLKGSSNFTRSGIRTRIFKQDKADFSKYHLLRFDDNPSHMQTLIRSQDRLDITALGTRYETIGGDRNLTVGWIDTKHQAVGGNYVAKIYQDYHLHVGDPGGPFSGGHRYELVEQDYDLEVKKETNFKLDGDWSVSVGGKASISADTIVLNAIKSITLMVGSSIIVIQSDGIYNEAAIHYEQCGADGEQPASAVVQPPNDPRQADAG